MDRWKGKVAVVTGASVGIGAAISTTLADQGVTVVGLARRAELIEALPTKGKIHAIKCDLTNKEEIEKAFRWIDENLGGVDILINNAGLLKMSKILDTDAGAMESMWNLNVMAVINCCKEAMRTMKTKDEGHIININSIAGHQVLHSPGLSFGPYCTTKFALTSLTESLRMELLNEPIKVTSICPGPVNTDMLKNIAKELSENIPNKDMDTSILEPEEVADTVLYVLSTGRKVEIQEIKLQTVGWPKI